jgi:hypothetical protein
MRVELSVILVSASLAYSLQRAVWAMKKPGAVKSEQALL